MFILLFGNSKLFKFNLGVDIDNSFLGVTSSLLLSITLFKSCFLLLNSANCSKNSLSNY